jgi:hypothetical protein
VAWAAGKLLALLDEDPEAVRLGRRRELDRARPQDQIVGVLDGAVVRRRDRRGAARRVVPAEVAGERRVALLKADRDPSNVCALSHWSVERRSNDSSATACIMARRAPI